LADENTPVRELAAGRAGFDRARRALERLDEAGGRAAFAQRFEKKSLQEAERAPLYSGLAVPADAADSLGARGGYGAAGGMPSAPRASAASRPAGPALRVRDIDSDEEIVVESVQVVGKETLYKRGKQWFAANAQDVDLERDADEIETIERFSEDYFQLVAKNTQMENAVLARQQPGEELIIRLRGQVYRIR
jgi:Ca-activated chloride channel family protein